jgi:hypothetical protein
VLVGFVAVIVYVVVAATAVGFPKIKPVAVSKFKPLDSAGVIEKLLINPPVDETV